MCVCMLVCVCVRADESVVSVRENMTRNEEVQLLIFVKDQCEVWQ